MRRTRGASAIWVLLGLAAAALVGLYLFSDVFKTKADRALRQFSEWTPENIAKDPLAYLDFAEKQANDATQSLKATEIAVAQRRAKLEGMKGEAAGKVQAGAAALDDLKAKYRAAEAASSWPVEWQGEKRTRDFVRSQILTLHGQVESQRGLEAKVAAGLSQLDLQTRKVLEQRAKVAEQVTTIQTNREMLKVQQITDDIKNQLVNLRGVLESTVAAVGASESAPLSLDQITAGAAAQVDSSKFDEIMGK